MPRRVDHEERRRQIADALVRTAATRGLHATGMREVAAEAGVSLRLVQYYFGTKQELLLAAMQQLATQFSDRVLARIRQMKATGSPASPRDVIAAILTEGLPADDERRTLTLVYTAYLALSLTDPALAISPLVRNSNAVIDVVAAQTQLVVSGTDTVLSRDPAATCRAGARAAVARPRVALGGKQIGRLARWQGMGHEQDEFADFYRASKDSCLRAVTAVVGDRELAEEQVAEAFTRAWMSWGKVRRHAAPRAWVVRTALNLGVSWWRRRHREVPLADHDAATPAGAGEGVDPALIAALRRLPTRQREVLALRIFLDLDTETTAKVLGIAPGTVTAHLSRSVAALRRALPSANTDTDAREVIR